MIMLNACYCMLFKFLVYFITLLGEGVKEGSFLSLNPTGFTDYKDCKTECDLKSVDVLQLLVKSFLHD